MNKSNDVGMEEINFRITALEKRISSLLGKGDFQSSDRTAGELDHYCGLPVVPEREFTADVSANREELIRVIDKKWVNGTNLRYYLFDTPPMKGSASNVKYVRDAFKVWRDVGIGITFEEVQEISEAEIRIGFMPGGSWSYVGRDNLSYPGQYERTMNIGWELKHDRRGIDVAVHEIGHALGFPHAHQNPFSGIVWDEEAVYTYFAGEPNKWDKEKTYHNVLRKLKTADVEGSNWDPNSIMEYGFPEGLILQPPEYADGLEPELGLSETDKEQVRIFYPPISASDEITLHTFQSQKLDLQAAEQCNLYFKPAETREYTFKVFGCADLLMVLFRRVGKSTQYVAGSDDSGTNDNATITVRMIAGDEYILRVRMFANMDSSTAAIMVW